MLIEYKLFYRKHGVRRPGQLLRPPTMEFSQLKLPKRSSIHFPQYDDSNFEIPQSHFLASDIKRYMFCDVKTEYAGENHLGMFRLAPGKPIQLTRMYFRTNRRIRRYEMFSPIHDPLTVVFHTYGLLNRRYVYLGKRRDTVMNKWKNHWDTVITNLNAEAEAGIRNQFIVIDVPEKLPAFNKLKRQDDLSIQSVRYFKQPDHWMANSVWNFFSAPKENGTGLAYIFRNLTDKAVDNVNIIWKSGNICTITNLGILRSFNTVFNERGKWDSFRFNKYLLNMFLVLGETTEVNDVDTSDEDEDNDDDTTLTRLDTSEDIDDIDELGEDDETDYSEEVDLDALFDELDADDDRSDKEWVEREKARNLDLNVDNVKEDKAQKRVSGVTKGKTPIEEEFEEEDVDSLDDVDDIVDQRLAALDKMEEVEDTTAGDDIATSQELAYTTYAPETLPTTEYDQLVINTATEQARNGTLTAGELRLASKRAETYKTLKDPRNPKKDFIDALTVTEGDIRLDGDTQIANEVTKSLVPDDTMHQSSLKQFDRKYINEVMPKHISKTVMEVAKAGVTIQDYDIERVNNINDDFEIHSVRLTTVAGKQSTLRFRLPVVDENGQFKVGGVKSRMRKQWADKY